MTGDIIAGAMGAALGATLIAATGVAAAQTMPILAKGLTETKPKKHGRKSSKREIVSDMIWG